MNGCTFDAQLENIDNELTSAGVPLRYRPLDCFKKLYGSVPDGPQREKLFDPVTEWYLKRYGEAIRWDGAIARFPILIRGVVFLGQARFVAEQEILAPFEEGIEGLSKDLAQSLTPEEKRPIMEKLIFGSRSFYSLHNLLIDDDWLAETERNLARRALYDLENAAVTLKHTGDTQAAIVQAHEAAEKYLKAALSKSGNTKPLKAYGHDIPKLFKDLLKTESRYFCLSLPVENLQKLSPSMELRYSNVPRSLEMATEAYHGALYVCGMIAQMWLFDKARGTTRPRFKECSFYLDGANTTFYCKKVQGDSAVLTLFRSSKYMGSQMADITMSTSQSALYLEVTDPLQDAQLRAQFAAHLRNPGRRVSPEEIGIQMVHGSEGSYVTALLKTPIVRPKA
ncbi:MAG: HEPN domain-containing protein [Acidobacteriaceae bacterium]|nr:HEPN domain-containing protein [Acidobacteriaceae bacterium]